jgi:hypothetical protein
MTIGSVISMPASGRMGVVVGSAAIGEPVDGKQRVVMQVKSEAPETQTRAASMPAPVTAAHIAAQLAAETSAGAGAYEIREPKVARDPNDLTAEEKTAIDRLRQRDGQVRQEEQAHAGTAGAAAGPISYTYATGPDGRQYAVGGEVSVRLSNPSGDPAQYAQAAVRLSAAAHAAHNPSAADLSAASKGYQALAAALAEKHRAADTVA